MGKPGKSSGLGKWSFLVWELPVPAREEIGRGYRGAYRGESTGCVIDVYLLAVKLVLLNCGAIAESGGGCKRLKLMIIII
jgi:hypothetical protein